MARSLAAVLRFYHPGAPAVDLDRLLADIAPRNWSTPPMLRFYARDGAPIGIACAQCNPLPLPHQRIDLSTLDEEGREEFLEGGREQYFSIIVPVRGAGDSPQGALEVVLPLRQVNQALAGTTRRFLFFTVALTVGLGAVIFFIARWSISQPLRQLIGAARRLGSGDLALRIEPSGVVDLDQMGEELNRMASSLEEQHRIREEFYRQKLELERGLRHAEKLASLGQLTSGLAHEIGTPLNVISGRAEQLLSRMVQDDPGRKGLESIIRQSEQIAELIERLLAFSRKDVRCWDEVDLSGLVQEALNLCRMRFSKNDFAVALELDLALAKMTGDSNALRQLFVNLMLNAIQAMGGQGLIRVTSVMAEENLQIVFEDSGPGIPAELREKVFEPFFTSKDVGEGTGLGLYIAANVVEDHGGNILIEDRPGGGARFVMNFPSRGKEMSQ
ncbi:sensor histidine kinase [Desulfuromonas sp. DDH964]|uniref:sensor histidine kinase n=1 Tax=Desulfuromonas sp. DDH964 TaxID=1823759 RepID=UPI0018D3F58B|nr:HAMP domain-containing sensor histidine kinase [Desulfuromonas sp. DDH964]